jgi:GTP-binding protein
VVPVSALQKRGANKLMKAVFNVYALWNKRIPTAGLNRWFSEVVQRHAPPTAAGRRIKLRYITQSNARPPTFVVFCSQPEALPTAYTRYLVNDLRESFDMRSVPIRLHLRKGKNPYAPGRS